MMFTAIEEEKRSGKDNASPWFSNWLLNEPYRAVFKFLETIPILYWFYLLCKILLVYCPCRFYRRQPREISPSPFFCFSFPQFDGPVSIDLTGFTDLIDPSSISDRFLPLPTLWWGRRWLLPGSIPAAVNRWIGRALRWSGQPYLKSIISQSLEKHYGSRLLSFA